MTANLLIDQYAAGIRERNGAKPSTVRAGVRRVARRAAADFQKDLPGIDDEQLGAVLLRAAAFAQNLAAAQPAATARDVAGLLGVAGEHLYHHAAAEPECEG